MTEEERLKRNQRQREYYQLNKEKEQKRNREKFKRLKTVWKDQLTPERKEILRLKNKENQRKHREKYLEAKRVKYHAEKGNSKAVVSKPKPNKIAKSKITKLPIKKVKEKPNPITLENLRNFQKPRYSVFEIMEVLRKHIHHRLNNKQIAKWDYLDWADFEELKLTNEK